MRFPFKAISRFLFIFITSFAITGCGPNTSAQTQAGRLVITEVVGDLNHPWALAFLPGGGILITERSGSLRYLGSDSTLSETIEGVPQVWAQGQGGLLDIAIHPDFERNNYVYLSYSKPMGGGEATTALGRGKWMNGRLQDFEEIFIQENALEGPNHFGSRIVFHEGYLYLALGERFQFEPAQDLTNHLGTIVRLNYDGSIPSTNPFVNSAELPDALPAIWSFGHRNIEAAAVDPSTGLLWVAEMGPKGGDELNLVEMGNNYGWPIVSWGEHYDGEDIADPPTHPEFADATIHWTPVISPSGMVFYTGDLFGDWQGHMMIGGLTAKGVVVVEVNGRDAREVDRIDIGSRTRDVAVGQDGAIYVLTDQNNGKLLRITK